MITRFFRGILGLREQDNLLQWRLDQHIQRIEQLLKQPSAKQVDVLTERFENFARLQVQNTEAINEAIAAIRRDLALQAGTYEAALAKLKAEYDAGKPAPGRKDNPVHE